MGVIFTKQKPNKCRHMLLHFINIILKEFVKEKCFRHSIFAFKYPMKSVIHNLHSIFIHAF